MWGLRRGIAAAAAGGLRLPKLVTPPPFACWPPTSGINYGQNFTAISQRSNFWKSIEDPELNELIKLYNCACKKCGNTSVDSQKWQEEGKVNYTEKSNVSFSYSTDKLRSVGSKVALKKSKLDIPKPYAVNKRVSFQEPGNSSKWKSIEDPELDELMELYDRVSKTNRRSSVASRRLRKERKFDYSKKYDKSIGSQQALKKSNDRVSKSYRSTSEASKILPNTGNYDAIDSYTSIGSQDVLKKINLDIPQPYKVYKKILLQQNNKETSSKSPTKLRKSGKNKYNIEIPKEMLMSHKSSRSKRSSKAQKTPKLNRNTITSYSSSNDITYLEAWKLPNFSSERKKSLEAQRGSKSSNHSEKSGTHLANQQFSADLQDVQFKELPQVSQSTLGNNLTQEDTLYSEDDEDEVMRKAIRPSLAGSCASRFENMNMASMASLVPSNNDPNQVYHFQFAPINLVKYKVNFLSSQSLNPCARKNVWPKIWPKPLERRQRRNVKSENPSFWEPVLTKKRSKRQRLCKAASQYSQAQSSSFKYHYFPVKDLENYEGRRRRVVACQTEDLPDGCELCNLCRPCSQPDEPFLKEMKQRQDREALKRYYLRMRERERRSSVADSKKCSKLLNSKESSSSRWEQLRRQLVQCQSALTLCGQLVEAQLSLGEISAGSEASSGVPEPKQC